VGPPEQQQQRPQTTTRNNNNHHNHNHNDNHNNNNNNNNSCYPHQGTFGKTSSASSTLARKPKKRGTGGAEILDWVSYIFSFLAVVGWLCFCTIFKNSNF
jgi:hypothetical protein